MPLFQKSVVKKYINDLNADQLQAAWLGFQNHFHNTAIQQNIINAKEEEYQEGFVRDLFVNILGYTLKPQPEFNLVMEQKSTTDATKSDGAILSTQGSVVAVIELKDTGTANLDKVEKQAFGYKHQHKDCRYVVTANFEQLRFYINDATEYEEFNLFTLNRESFALLFCCLQRTALHNDVPLKMKQQSLSAEENVTKKLYEDYSRFKKQLFANITAQNPQFTPLELFKKTQKLLDRLLFILFAEDRLLLPPNSIREILLQWDQLKELDQYVPLYDRFKKYFGYMNTGYIGKQYEIFAYNGGLFAADEILDNIIVEDQMLYDSCKGLSNYDFESEVDVNILGHIFEHSLGEIEAVERELSNPITDIIVGQEKQTSKRKKDGVFYTPRYITKYIVDNTVGALCTQKRLKLDIIDEAFAPQKRKSNTKQLLQKLEAYRQWLLQLTICDPACGSGAFLNQALEFLIAEHQSIDTLTSKLFGAPMILSDIEANILEHNLYGVDINNEATEIAKLSLWLRTARKGRKLNSLNNHIKCGNSLIDDAEIAGEQAFNWHQEFPEVFAKGGFDIVIGNPPYVDIKALPKKIVNVIFERFKTADNRINLFSVFIEKSIDIMKPNGKFSFIIPSALLTQDSYKLIRKHLLEKVTLNNIVRLPNESFGGGAGEVKVDTIILSFTSITSKANSLEVLVYKGFERITEISQLNADLRLSIPQSNWLHDHSYIFRINSTNTIDTLIDKIESGSTKLINCAEFCLGLTPYDKYTGHTPEQIESKAFHASYKKDETYKRLLAGNDVTKYNVAWNGKDWISYGNWLGAAREERFFKEKRILVKQIIDWSAKTIWAGMTNEALYNTQNAFNLIAREGYHTEYLLVLLNSKLISFFHRKKFLEEYKDRFQKILIKDCKEFPIKIIPRVDQQKFISVADIMVSRTNELQDLKQKLLRLLQSKFENLSLSKKLQDWPRISFKEFLKELEKLKVKFSLSEQAEWMQYFEAEKTKANTIQQLIKETDKKINEMVYSLYDLSEAEKSLIEAG